MSELTVTVRFALFSVGFSHFAIERRGQAGDLFECAVEAYLRAESYRFADSAESEVAVFVVEKTPASLANAVFVDERRYILSGIAFDDARDLGGVRAYGGDDVAQAEVGVEIFSRRFDCADNTVVEVAVLLVVGYLSVVVAAVAVIA